MELISTASGNEDAVALISTASLGASLNGFISRWDSQQKPGLAPVKMSNSLQANQTTQERSVESEILGGPGVEDETIDMDFSLPDLDCTDPTFLYFEPFPSTNYEIPSFLSPDVPVGAIDQTMTTDNDLFQRSRELNALHSKLQKRIDELEETCRRLENEFHCMQSRFWSVESYLSQLGAWYFNFKAAVNKNAAVMSGKMESLTMGTSFF